MNKYINIYRLTFRHAYIHPNIQKHTLTNTPANAYRHTYLQTDTDAQTIDKY